MPNVDWSYHRNNCTSCSRAASFLAEHEIAIAEQADARKTPLVDADALQLTVDADHLYVTRGTKVIHFDLRRNRPDDDSLLELLIGRSGKLRAPALKTGRTLIVGFDQSTYEHVFCPQAPGAVDGG
jgi:arsenate reductase-like glutaredoxin family protein